MKSNKGFQQSQRCQEAIVPKIDLGKQYMNKQLKKAITQKQGQKRSQRLTNRLRYSFKSKNRHNNQINKKKKNQLGQQLDNSFKFYDTQYFLQKNNRSQIPSVTICNDRQFKQSKNQSFTNLLQEIGTDHSCEQKLSLDKYNTIEVKQISQKQPNIMAPPAKCLYMKINYKQQIKISDSPVRAKSSLESSKMNTVFKSRERNVSIENRLNSNREIDPYTKREYLHVKQKNQDTVKKKIQELKKKKMFTNILKPCQIFQKKLSHRENYKNKSIESPASYSLKNRTQKQKKRAMTAVPFNKTVIQTIEPWQIDQPQLYLEQAVL